MFRHVISHIKSPVRCRGRETVLLLIRLETKKGALRHDIRSVERKFDQIRRRSLLNWTSYRLAMADTSVTTEEKRASQDAQPGEAPLKSEQSSETIAPRDDDNIVYPTGITLILIIVSLCLSVFLVNREANLMV